MPERLEREPKPAEAEHHEHQRAHHEHSGKVESRPNLDKLRHQIAHEARGSKEVSVGEKESPADNQPITVNRDLINSSYHRSLKSVQAKLTGIDRLASKVIHKPTVEQISNVGAQTVARPSGIIGGASGALIGSLALLMMAKHYGLTYNYLMIFLFYTGGFVIGLLIEIIYRLFRPRRQNI